MGHTTFLLTFPNQLTSPYHIIGATDFSEGTFSWYGADVFKERLKCRLGGASGACILEQCVAFCNQGEKPHIFLFDPRKGEFAQIYKLQRAKDPHSIILHQNYLYVVSTGTNGIFRIAVEGNKLTGEEEIFWQFPGASPHVNEVHLNGIAFSKMGAICSCFGKRNSSGRRNGSIFYLNGEGTIRGELNQPHSPLIFGDKLVFADSGNGKIFLYQFNENSQTFLGELETGGYPRGIAYCQPNLFVAISSMRNISRSQGRMLVDQNLIFDTSVLEINIESLIVEKEYPLKGLGREIYDILPLSPDIHLQPLSAALESRIHEMEITAESFFESCKAEQNKLTAATEEIQFMRNSKSWKITAPLRWISGVFS